MSDPRHPTGTHFDWHEVAAGILLAVVEPDAVNLVLVRGGDSDPAALVVDTGSTPQQGAQVREDVIALTGREPAQVVITHGHRDHWFGLAGFDGIPSVGHADLARLVDTRQTATEAAALGQRIGDLRLPSRLLHLALGVDLGGRRVEIVHLGPGHSGADLVVVVPDAGVLIAGDLLESADVPQVGPDSDLGQWPLTLDGVIGVLDEHSVIVPGHGPVMDRVQAIQQRAELAAIMGEARSLVERGIPEDEAAERGNWPWPADKLNAPVANAYAELAAQGLQPRPQLPIVLERGPRG